MDMQIYNNTLPHYDPKIDRFVLDLNARATKARYYIVRSCLGLFLVHCVRLILASLKCASCQNSLILCVVRSVKNTIVHRDAKKKMTRIWLFGKTGENEFNVDMAWPISPVQGFAFALATLHSKS